MANFGDGSEARGGFGYELAPSSMFLENWGRLDVAAVDTGGWHHDTPGAVSSCEHFGGRIFDCGGRGR